MQPESASFLKRKIGEHRKRHRSSVSQDVKLDVLDRHAKGERSAHIAHLLGLPPTTVRTIIKNREKILETAKLVPKHVSLKLTRLRSDRMEKMECLLSLWLQDLYQQNAPVSLALIQEKAISLYKDIEIEGETGKPVPFSASRGWFHRFQKRYGFKNVRMQGEAASIGKDLAEGFPETLKTIIEEGSYDPRQIFNADETGLYWKRLPSRTHISVHEKAVPGFPASKDRLSLLLGANASGDMKLKPLLVYHSENPPAMKNYVKSQLPVLWKSHKRAWITRQIFRDWFMDYFVPEAKKYCEEKDLAFKVLLVLDSASAHDLDFESLCPNVKVVLIPPRSTSLVQPMDQGVIAKFKASYLRRTFYRLIQETDGEGKRTIQEFWEEFNIMDGVMMISAAWEEIPSHIMNGAWKNLYPEAVYHLVDFQEALVHREVAQLAKEAGFQEIEEDDIKEWLISHSLPLSKEDLIELHKQHPQDSRVSENEEKGRDKDAGLTIPVLQRVFDLYKEIVDILTKSDVLGVRSARAIAVMADGLSCYRKILDAKLKHSSQATMDIFLIQGIRKDPKLFMDELQLGTSDIKRQKTIHAVVTAEEPPGAAVSPAVFDSNSTDSSSHHPQPSAVLAQNRGSCNLRNLEGTSLAKVSVNSLMTEDQDAADSKQKEAGIRNSEIVPFEDLKEVQNRAVPPEVKQEPAEGLQERWEAQWQEFLKTVQTPQSGWRIPQTSTLKPEEEMKDFQAMTEACCWPVGENGSQSLPHRDTRAPYERPDPSVKVKEEAPDVDALSLEGRCQRFRHFRYQETEGPRETLHQLGELCQQWLRPERHTIEQVFDLVVLEQFLAILPLGIQTWVRGRGPETCTQAAALTEEFLLRQQEVEKGSRKA